MSSWYSYEREQESGRRNDAGGASVDEHELCYPFEEGSMRYVARGVYSSGRREGQQCVVKWDKRGCGTDSFADALRASDRALEFVSAFNKAKVMDSYLVLNMPEAWNIGEDEDSRLAGRQVLIEPFICDFVKWNSNTGWYTDECGWARAMQALSHFSYDFSGGRQLLCDLQGGFYNYAAVLTDPVVCSTRREFGATDLGWKGIVNFFAEHECNEFCDKDWDTPPRPRSFFEAKYGTTMVQALNGRRI